MSRRRRGEEPESPRYDSFIYDDTADGNEVLPAYRYPDSFYPEEHLRRRRPETPESGLEAEAPAETPAADEAPAEDAAPEADLGDLLRDDSDPEPWAEEAPVVNDEGKHKKKRRSRRRQRIAGPEAEEESTGIGGRTRKVLVVLLTLLVSLTLGAMFLFRIQDGMDFLRMPESLVARVVAPAQGAFASASGFLSSLFQSLKTRSALEQEYNRLAAENEELTRRAMLADEYQIALRQYENMYDEVSANLNMDPLVCRVTGKDEGNYFSTFTINKGSRDGLANYMAVTISGALIGYTENVRETSATVRTIIDSEASIAALIQSSRDQGIISGTLGIDGQPLCRMYYLSDDNLPRPGDLVVTSGVSMSFPKGIPIGAVRESTRNMDQNKKYIVVEPQADFRHIEYVIVLRYKPQAEAVTGRESAASRIEFVELPTIRPMPTLRIGSLSIFGTPTPDPNAPTAAPAATTVPVTPRPTATPSPTPVVTPTPDVPIYEYRVVVTGPTPTPSPSPSPSPTPFITLRPEDMTYEDD